MAGAVLQHSHCNNVLFATGFVVTEGHMAVAAEGWWYAAVMHHCCCHCQ